MTVAELREILANLPSDDHVCVAAWFEDGERLYLPHRELGEPRAITVENMVFHIVGRFDNCPAHRLEWRNDRA